MQAVIENIKNYAYTMNMADIVELICEVLLKFNDYNEENSKAIREIFQIINKGKTS